MTRPVRAHIDLSALTFNLSQARRAAPDSRVMAVVKADGYGHGMLAVATALQDADAFAVASLDEGLQLRNAGIEKPVLLLEGVFSATELTAVMQHHFELVVHQALQLEWLETLDVSARLSVWLKVDTGMNRLGFAPGDALAAWDRLEAMPQVETLQWMSHFACADEPEHTANDHQESTFRQLCMQREAPRSLANSAALLTRPSSHVEWVRPGIMLYGASPMAAGHACPVELRPVMTLGSELIAVHHCRKGDAVGYGQAWVCPEDMPVGVVAAGYGDGYPRHAPSGTPVLVNGEVAELIGRVSMDMLCVDLRTQPQARAGDPVVLWGEGLPVESVAGAAGTISYALLCGVTPRVPRRTDGVSD
ncbi:alanine racemase [Thiogranum longum]|uniref:Alanine racemase n=1 Tax=Thiogranum longum TaxID=1537524 RepID=A0A4R1HAI2_9GAMM|nr:alanine racemase [Thiogranum longum]TCK18944.1 alanine racemase [Thiogranum longum]